VLDYLFVGHLILILMKNWFKKRDMEQNNGVQTEDLLQEVEVETLPETENTDTTEGGNNSEITALKQEIADLKDKYLRQAAEFENAKRRQVREKMDILQTAARDTLSALLPVLDDFDRASKNETFTEGVNLVYQKLFNICASKGLKVMDSPAGADFDPDQHEAITEIPAGEALAGKIVDTVEKGYLLNEKIIRYAKVVVGK
jgi:molecular chaperone GrpE